MLGNSPICYVIYVLKKLFFLNMRFRNANLTENTESYYDNYSVFQLYVQQACPLKWFASTAVQILMPVLILAQVFHYMAVL
jgi:hypothetical protein